MIAHVVSTAHARKREVHILGFAYQLSDAPYTAKHTTTPHETVDTTGCSDGQLDALPNVSMYIYIFTRFA